MDHLITIFAGRNGLGQSWTYRANMPGPEIEKCHAHGCEVIGLVWSGVCDEGYDISAEQAASLLKIPGMVHPEDSNETSLLSVNRFGSDKWREAWPYHVGDPGFAAIYLAVAKHGAAAMGLDLKAAEASDAYVIDAGGEYYSAVS